MPESATVSPISSSVLEAEVLKRYAAGAADAEPGLCCPAPLRSSPYLAMLPVELIEKDYGCGDPAEFVREGESVLDLGSGSGKACYILAQKVGRTGRVTGIDFNPAMLALARKYTDHMADRLGYRNFRFHRARIQDLALDLDAAASTLDLEPIRSLEALAEFDARCERLRREKPLVPDGSVDVIVSNCVLNLVRPEDKARLFREMHRVLRVGGRAIISDVVCDEDPTPAILGDPALWSGCISGAFREHRFLEAFEEAGFYGIEILRRSAEPWQVLDGIEFRSITVRAFKGKEGPCLERDQAVIYRGPWKEVRDDDGHVLRRGHRMAVCDKTFGLLTSPTGPYAAEVLPVPPLRAVPLDRAAPFDCRGGTIRDPRATKGADFRETRAEAGAACCAPGDESCC